MPNQIIFLCFRPGVVFPTKETHSEIFDGVRFDELPILNIRATKNNTIASCDRHNGKFLEVNGNSCRGGNS